MNIEKFDMLSSEAVEKRQIATQTLNKRMQDEMVSLVILAAEVQIALGATVATAESLSPSVQRSLQAIDRLQQTLDDLQRVIGYLASYPVEQHVAIEPLSEVMKLRHLAHKLFDNVDAPFALSEDDSGEISWF